MLTAHYKGMTSLAISAYKRTLKILQKRGLSQPLERDQSDAHRDPPAATPVGPGQARTRRGGVLREVLACSDPEPSPGPGLDPGTDPGSNTGAGPGLDSGSESGSDYGSDPGLDPGPGPKSQNA
jgi:hypothetical protein